MKQKSVWILASCCLFLLTYLTFSHLRQQYAPPAPVPSVQGGYYDQPFTLTFRVPEGGTVYYTTDGSTPDENSSVYTGGILIQDRSEEPNHYNAIQNVILDWNSFTPDPTPVKKGTVIRAVYINRHGISSEPITQTYFVGLQPPEQGCTLSLVFEEEDLFGEDGIYVTGKEYDAWYTSHSTDTTPPTPNFEKKLEIPAVAELMKVDGNILNQPVRMRLQGASARNEIKKRFTLVACDKYYENDVFNVSLFGSVASRSVMVKYYFPDAIVAELVSDRDVAVQRSVPVSVYLNGEFWYNSYMLERYDQQYFRQYYQIDDRILVKNGIMDTPSYNSPDIDIYAEFMYWVKHSDFSDNDEWEQLQNEIEVQSFIDYLAINYYFCNIDFGDDHNHVLWRSPTTGMSQYADSKWRWCLYDIDALEWVRNDPSRGDPASINMFHNDFTFNINKLSLYKAIKNNPDFQRDFVLSFMDIGNNNFSMEKVAPVLEKYGCDEAWLYDYFRERPAYAAQHLAEEFALTGTLETVTVRSSQPEMGAVQVNTSIIDLESGSWSGQYFTDYPITVTAIPNDGYTFLGWKGASGETASTIQLSVENGPVLEAVFAEIQ